MRALLLALVLLVPAAAAAQDPAPVRRVVLDEIHVHGHAPAPITLFLPRARVRFDAAGADHHALDRIVDSVTHAPF